MRESLELRLEKQRETEVLKALQLFKLIYWATEHGKHTYTCIFTLPVGANSHVLLLLLSLCPLLVIGGSTGGCCSALLSFRKTTVHCIGVGASS